MQLKNKLFRIIRIIVVLFVFLSGGTIAHADIYMYIDSDGVLHFTNTPTTSQYRLYIKERPREKDKNKEYDHLIREASRQFELSFSLIKAMIKVESNFDSRAVSRSGALGLMQIMPKNVKAFRIRDPFDPRDNIIGGARYFKFLLERFDGKLPLALAAYNAGPTVVDKYNNVPPIKETADYVEKVMKYYYLYNKS